MIDLGFFSLPWEVQDEINRHAASRYAQEKNEMESPNVTVVCTNPTCPAKDEPKKVHLFPLTRDVFMGGPLHCGICCNTDYEMKRV